MHKITLTLPFYVNIDAVYTDDLEDVEWTIDKTSTKDIQNLLAFFAETIEERINEEKLQDKKLKKIQITTSEIAAPGDLSKKRIIN